MKVACIIQQRLGSTRLPGKALLPLVGKSMTQNIVDRVKRAKLVDEVVVAVPFVDWPKFVGIDGASVSAFRCVEENDLIGRYYETAKAYGADLVMRVCGDNPCVEPEYIDQLIRWEKTIGYAGMLKLILNSESGPQGHDGFGGEIYSLEMLEWMDRTIKASDYREHPHKFWFDIERYNYCGKNYPPGFRLDVNTQADYEKVKRIYDHFGGNEFHVEDAVRFLGSAKIIGG